MSIVQLGCDEAVGTDKDTEVLYRTGHGDGVGTGRQVLLIDLPAPLRLHSLYRHHLESVRLASACFLFQLDKLEINPRARFL
jgi:hypothetical protein